MTDPKYAYPPQVPPRRPTNSMAIAALILGIASLFTCQLVGIGAIICGNRARNEIRGSGEEGDGMALAGLILGWVSLAILVLVSLFMIAYFVLFGAALLNAPASSY
ncbi:hypothetical protein J2S43_006459 [Catenuloplanes nepalensis]|uniref:DUF4190 domain-containing protein n=1 Tax=Catenuloplanes nepalensis TaxID=587533 RepID=A0ABT9N2N2_9ACTN|nr:DUF4190 domain-containing protein [Catenuloplanes nepalensis]MDP9797947.1 hypothetical protein [Catenuloplanes nepalensis]